ncbi:MAG: DUF1573 domain-containing protein [bacterium]|nr:DUF1573 domain-containing protein [bacterium]
MFGGIVWIARPDLTPSATLSSASSGALAVQGARSYDFGTISMARGPVTREFKLTNTGSGAITIDKLYTSCMCTAFTR